MIFSHSTILTLGGIAFFIALFIIGRIFFYGRRAVLAGKQATPVSNLKPGAHKRILVIGDSTSYGTGATQPENSLVGRLVRDFPESEIINASENGMDITRLEKKLGGMTHEKFDIVMLHIGGVDTIAFTRNRTIVSCINKIREHTKLMGAHTVALVSMNNVGSLPLAHFPFTTIYSARSRRVTNLFEKTCVDCDLVHIPLYTENKTEPLLRNGKNHFSTDKMHPNDEGYGIWYQKIKEIIHPYITQ